LYSNRYSRTASTLAVALHLKATSSSGGSTIKFNAAHLIGIGLCFAATPARAEIHVGPTSAATGLALHAQEQKPWEDIRLYDTWGARTSLKAVAKKTEAKAIVVFSLNTSCPLLRKYVPALQRLEKEWRAQGVQIVGVDAVPADTMNDIRSFAHDFELPFPILQDSDQALVNALNLTMTPEFAVLDSDLKLRYRGALDDQYTTTRQLKAPQNEYVKDAVKSVLASETVALKETIAEGCPLPRGKEKPVERLTFHEHILPILQKKCQTCHRTGEVAEFLPLDTYKNVSKATGAIRRMVGQGLMPPWDADKAHYVGGFSNDRSLDDPERETILSWIATGHEAGDPKKAPAPRVWAKGWEIGKPDAVFSIGKDGFNVPAEGEIDYQYFTVPTNFDEDRWVNAIEVHPGGAGVVHHAIVHITAPVGEKTLAIPTYERIKQIVDAWKTIPESKRPPFTAYAKKLLKLNALYDPARAAVLGSYVPGQATRILPEGTAIKIPKGATLTFEMHYTPNGTAMNDKTEVGVKFTSEPERAVRTNPLGTLPVFIPAGDPYRKIVAEHLIEKDSEILSLQPHMHKRGKSWRYELVFPDGKTQTILAVPRFDFNWQTTYEFKTPVKVPGGTKIRSIAVWDNSRTNPRNPFTDPPENVPWGFQTDEEMMNGWLTYVEVKPGAKK
jgi:thiol-disulfide isomerase/thioredoxin